MSTVAQFLPILFPIGIVVLIVIGVHFASKAEEAKQLRMMQFAIANGLTFSPNLGSGIAHGSGFFAQLFAFSSTSSSFLGKYHQFQPVSGRSTTVKYIFEGKANGHDFEAFQFQYTTSSGKSSQTHYFMVASIEVPGWFSKMVIEEEGFLDGIGKMLGMQDVQLDSSHFNERYRVQGDDEKAIFDLLHPQMMEFVMRWNPPGFQLDGNRVVVYKNGILVEEFVKYSLEFFEQFWDHVPEYVKQDRGANRV